ncbi:VOC family protein [Lysinimonas soli]|uniref:VOC family protein n=1 Tax=Lysinimonas soli TaxID=1074233 RepID=A0ABW0NQ26_9MICO
MLTTTGGFSGFSVDDLERATAFYRDTLGLKVMSDSMGLRLNVTGGAPVFVYEKPNHVPATFTVLNLEVPDIDVAVDELSAAGVKLEIYPGTNQDERGIARGRAANRGPDIAWFLDPAGNILSVLQG